MNISPDPSVIPDTVSAATVKLELKGPQSLQSGACPGCRVENFNNPSPMVLDWVKCPIYHDQYICEGCCIDISSVAHDEYIEDNPYKSLLNEAATKTGHDVSEVRIICLRHQIVLLQKMLANAQLPEVWKEMREGQLQSFTKIYDEIISG